jgi:site-specific recombinase XerD
MDRIGDLNRLARSFERHLRAEGKAHKTIATYGEAVAQFSAYAAGTGITGVSDVTPEPVKGFIAHLVNTRARATAANRFRALQAFFKWLVEDEHLESSPTAKMHGHQADADRVVQVNAYEAVALGRDHTLFERNPFRIGTDRFEQRVV